MIDNEDAKDTKNDEARSGEHEVDSMAGSITVDKRFLNALFCTAYMRGHEATVEGCYIDVLSSDWDTYFDEDTTEIIEESNRAISGKPST